MTPAALLPAPLQPASLERIARHLRITLTPEEHTSLLDQYRTPAGRRYEPYNKNDEKDDPKVRRFWEAFPEYVIARCPICGAAYTERMDTHSLDNVWLLGRAEAIYSEQYRSIGCWHWVAVQGFINLNGIVPGELKYHSSKSEVPYVTPIFLTDDPVSYVVMHSLPICRVEDGKFVPRYLLYMLTYYSEDPNALYERRRKDAERGKGDPDFRLPWMYTWGEAAAVPAAWDLVQWVTKGKLWWLDLDRDDLPLRSGPVEAFPYANIQGRRRPFIYRYGQLSISDYP